MSYYGVNDLVPLYRSGYLFSPGTSLCELPFWSPQSSSHPHWHFSLRLELNAEPGVRALE
jgi:hypothetical protein